MVNSYYTSAEVKIHQAGSSHWWAASAYRTAPSRMLPIEDKVEKEMISSPTIIRTLTSICPAFLFSDDNPDQRV